MREDKVTTYLALAKVLSERATCKRAKVGCIITDTNNHIVSAGYNGSPPGFPHCLDEDCLVVNNHCVRTLHAEMNALVRLQGKYDDLIGYCTHQPCFNCLKTGLIKGINSWWYEIPYKDEARDTFVDWYNSCKPHQKQILLLRKSETDKNHSGSHKPCDTGFDSQFRNQLHQCEYKDCLLNSKIWPD